MASKQAWPNGKKIAVSVTVMFETWSEGAAPNYSVQTTHLKSGTVDATMVLPPFNFLAEAAGFKNLGLVIDYVKDYPFTGLEVAKPWASKHQDLAKGLLAALDQSAAWFYAPENRDALCLRSLRSGWRIVKAVMELFSPTEEHRAAFLCVVADGQDVI